MGAIKNKHPDYFFKKGIVLKFFTNSILVLAQDKRLPIFSLPFWPL